MISGGGSVARSIWGAARLCQCPLASYHQFTFFRLFSLSLELCAKKMHWGQGRDRSVVSERKEASEAEISQGTVPPAWCAYISSLHPVVSRRGQLSLL